MPTRVAGQEGRIERSPWRIGWSGWKSVLLGIGDEIKRDRISLVAAGAAFFAFLAVFPALVTLISLYGLFTAPEQVEQQLEPYAGRLPSPVADLMQQQMERIAQAAPDALGWSAVIGILIALWSANKGMKAMVQAINVAYDEADQRGFVRLNALSLGLTLGAVLFVIVALATAAAIPLLLAYVGLGARASMLIDVLRWPLLAFVVATTVAALYQWAPNRRSSHWRWVVPGAVVSTMLFLVASGLFSWYVSAFGNYGEVYGSLAAVAILMLWLFLAAFAVLLGAEINAALERQARADASPSLEERPERAPPAEAHAPRATP